VDILVATGLAQSHRNGALQQIQQRYPAVRWVEASALPAVMATTDLAISAGGMTSYELAYMGVPAILLPATAFQAPVSAGLARHGAAINLGLADEFPLEGFLEAVRVLDASAEKRQEMIRIGQALFDGRGAERVGEAMLGSVVWR
jgi:spore coat polysaccharide biosynthesis predicted glycosyltransferase SpsG